MEALFRRVIQLFAAIIVAFVIRAHESIKPIVGDMISADRPKQEGSDRIAAHKRVEKSADFFRLPYKLSLDGWQKIPILFKILYDVADSQIACLSQFVFLFLMLFRNGVPLANCS